MPIYEYEPEADTCPFCLGGFEMLQKVGDAPLESCPECGNPCRQILSSFQYGGSPKTTLSPQNLDRKGFTQYVKRGDGYYEKTAGKGPGAIVDGDR